MQSKSKNFHRACKNIVLCYWNNEESANSSNVIFTAVTQNLSLPIIKIISSFVSLSFLANDEKKDFWAGNI